MQNGRLSFRVYVCVLLTPQIALFSPGVSYSFCMWLTLNTKTEDEHLYTHFATLIDSKLTTWWFRLISILRACSENSILGYVQTAG